MQRSRIVSGLVLPLISACSLIPAEMFGQDSGEFSAVYEEDAVPENYNCEETCGALPYFFEDQQSPGLSLAETKVHAHIDGGVAQVDLVQRYENSASRPFHANYVFPLPSNSAVFDMNIKIGDRVIVSEIKSRAEARAAYQKALSSGQTAALVEQERPNLFRQEVANIAPGVPVEVTLRYTQDLSFDGGEYEFAFPTHINPRFSPYQGREVSLSSDGLRPKSTSLSLDIEGKSPSLRGYRTFTHPTQATEQARGIHITLAPQADLAARDFVLRYRVSSEELRPQVTTHRSNNGGYLSLLLYPPVLKAKTVPRELVFVVDVSGSMAGEPLALCKQAMRESLAMLRPEDSFNVITFAGAESMLFPEARPNTQANRKAAESLLDGLTAGGGTMMSTAVSAALSAAPSSKRERFVFFMTDGLINNEAELHALAANFVKEQRTKGLSSRVFGFGVSPHPNTHLLDGLSVAGEGTTLYASTSSDAIRAVSQFFRMIESPALQDIRIDWGGLAVSDVYPSDLPDLFSGRPVVLHARYTGPGKGTITVSGNRAGEDVSFALPLALPEEELAHGMLPTLWARAKIEDLNNQRWFGDAPRAEEEITALGLEYRLVTEFTSLVAIDKQPRQEKAAPEPAPQAPEESETSASKASPKSGLYQMKAPPNAPAIKPAPGNVSITSSGTASSPFASTFGADQAAPVTSREQAEAIAMSAGITGLLGGRPGTSEGGYGLGLKGTGIDAGLGLGAPSPGRKASVAKGSAIVSGSLDKEIIDRVVRRAAPGLLFCYETERAKDPSLKGKITVSFTIDRVGSVTDAKIVSGFSKAVGACVAKKIGQLSFPAPTLGEVNVKYPLLFSPPESPAEPAKKATK